MENLVFGVIGLISFFVLLECIWTFVSGNWFVLPLIIVACFAIAAIKDMRHSLNCKYIKSHESMIESVKIRNRVSKSTGGASRDFITFEVTFSNTKQITIKIAAHNSGERASDVESICYRHLSSKG